MNYIHSFISSIKRWLIVKLGGYTDLNSPCLVKMYRPEIIPLVAKVSISNISYDVAHEEDVISSAVKSLAEKIMDGIISNNLYSLDCFEDSYLNAKTFRLEVNVVEPINSIYKGDE